MSLRHTSVELMSGCDPAMGVSQPVLVLSYWLLDRYLALMDSRNVTLNAGRGRPRRLAARQRE